MPTEVVVNGKVQKRPGTYSQIKSGISNPALALSYGNICIIDTGAVSAGIVEFAGTVENTYYGQEGIGVENLDVVNSAAIGSGINGTHKSGLDSVLVFNNITEYREAIRAGYLWLLGEPLFLPAGVGRGVSGASKVYYIKAATTVSASITFALSGAATLVFKPLAEGYGANGVEVSSNLTVGYAAKLVAGVIDTAKFKFQFYVASFKGYDTQNGNTPFDTLTPAQSPQKLLVESPELSTVQEVLDWCATSYEYQKYFAVPVTPTITGAGTITGSHVSAYPGNTLATGGSETYDSDDFAAVLEILNGIDNALFLTTDSADGPNSMGLNNTALLDYCVNTSKYEKFMIVGGGGSTSTTELKGLSGTNSQNIAAYYNSDKAIVCHGGIKKVFPGTVGTRTYNTLYTAFLAAGRIAGLEPQVPLTLKHINIDGVVHRLSENDQTFCLENGILYTYFDNELGKFVFGQDINTLLNNKFLVNNDGSSFSIAVKRITAQLNREIIINAKQTFFGSESGPNRNTISKESITSWLDGFLKGKIASTNNDDLITGFGGIEVTVNQDNYAVNYWFVPNFEVSKIVFTGLILDK